MGGRVNGWVGKMKGRRTNFENDIVLCTSVDVKFLSKGRAFYILFNFNLLSILLPNLVKKVLK